MPQALQSDTKSEIGQPMIDFCGLLPHFPGLESMDFPVNEVIALGNFGTRSLGRRLPRTAPSTTNAYGLPKYVQVDCESRRTFCLANQGSWHEPEVASQTGLVVKTVSLLVLGRH
jgi:hypothetical protein